MSNLPIARRGDKANDWPPWTDADTWELGPDPADAQWAAENLNEDWHTEETVPDDTYDRQAEVSEALDRLERGCLL